MLSLNGLQLLSDTLGWSYFLIWSVSFYPQALLNYRRKRVDGAFLAVARHALDTDPSRTILTGFSIDFATLNSIAFGCYAFYSFNFLFNERVREEYRLRHDGKDNSVALNDLAFTVHVRQTSDIERPTILTVSSLRPSYCLP